MDYAKSSHRSGLDRLARDEFERRWKQQFYDPAFERAQSEINVLAGIAWDAYRNHRKSPRTRKAGPAFADAEYDLAIEWLEARAHIQAAEAKQKKHDGPSQILMICASPRTDETCPSELSKTFRIAKMLREFIEGAGEFAVDFLDLRNLSAEYGRDEAFMEEAKNAARTLMEAVTAMRHGRRPIGEELEEPRPK